MELRQLEYFVAVVEEANFTRAAARLHLAQPGISAQIRRLEREVGQPLLDRSGRTVRTTAAGAAVLPLAVAALRAARDIRQTVDEFTGLLRGRVAIGLVTGAAAGEFDAAAVLADFHREHPRVEISLTEDTSDRMLAAVRRGELDIALVGLSGDAPPPDLALAVVSETPLVAAMAPADPLAGRAEVPLAALAERRLICLPPGTGIRSVFERACATAGFAPNVAFQASAPALLTRLAARGLGVAIVPAHPAPAEPGVVIRPLVEPVVRGQLALASRTESPGGPAVTALLGRLRGALGA